jgi:hypothetical protein
MNNQEKQLFQKWQSLHIVKCILIDHNNSSIACPVCFDCFEINKEIKFNCGHGLCYTCTISFINKQNNTTLCPCCREPIEHFILQNIQDFSSFTSTINHNKLLRHTSSHSINNVTIRKKQTI